MTLRNANRVIKSGPTVWTLIITAALAKTDFTMTLRMKLARSATTLVKSVNRERQFWIAQNAIPQLSIDQCRMESVFVNPDTMNHSLTFAQVDERIFNIFLYRLRFQMQNMLEYSYRVFDMRVCNERNFGLRVLAWLQRHGSA
jgi:hypothetical protein